MFDLLIFGYSDAYGFFVVVSLRLADNILAIMVVSVFQLWISSDILRLVQRRNIALLKSDCYLDKKLTQAVKELRIMIDINGWTTW